MQTKSAKGSKGPGTTGGNQDKEISRNWITFVVVDEWVAGVYSTLGMILCHLHTERAQPFIKQEYVTYLQKEKFRCAKCDEPAPQEVQDIAFLLGCK